MNDVWKVAKLGAGVCLSLLVCDTALAKDGMWEVNSKMQMEGMPDLGEMGIPGMPGPKKLTMCLPEGRESEAKPDDSMKSCQVLERKQSGKKTITKLHCKEGDLVAEHESLSPTQWRSKVTFSGEGATTMVTDAKRIGDCDMNKQGSAPEELVQMLKKEGEKRAENMRAQCRNNLAQWPDGSFLEYTLYEKDRLKWTSSPQDVANPERFSTPDVPECRQARASFCEKSKKLFAQMGTLDGFESAHKQYSIKAEGMTDCVPDYPSLGAKHCKSAVSQKRYEFVTAYCPAESEVLCKDAVSKTNYDFVKQYCPADKRMLLDKHCAGRGFTTVEPKYYKLCGYTPDGNSISDNAALVPDPEDANKPKPATVETTKPNPKDAAKDALGQGVDTLKKLFGF